ncbi:hypothetical protein L208DRAFT_1402523 [Tricholoma matsutake]|nr:hypothetical protein L208DRAFT_1402523 [Tricholoma matsutake 945]
MGMAELVRREAYINPFICISMFSLCRGENMGMAELRPSETRGLRKSILSHVGVFTL